ncbi:MAG: penicillin-binding protein 1A [Quisquiliibacterium sp.]
MPKPETAKHRASAAAPASPWLKLLGYAIGLPLAGAVCAALIAVIVVVLANDRLPDIDSLVDYRPKLPLRIYSADGVLIGEFGEERRDFVQIDDVPLMMRGAILAAEDARFFEHSGVDFVGIARAAVTNVLSGGRDQGASTITMQVARNFFLSSEKTYTRKIYEVLLALRIEQNLTKKQILEIYINQIFLGKRAYGFSAAAQIYFGKPLSGLSVAESAMLAGLPKAPSLYNPLVNPKRATERQHYILRRMYETGHLPEARYRAALKEELRYARAGPTRERAVTTTDAPFVAEMARALAFEMFKEETYVAGINVYTTILSQEQRAANAAVRTGTLEFDRRHGYRGPEAFLELPSDRALAEARIEAKLADLPEINDFFAAVVLQASPQSVRVSRGHGVEQTITGASLKFVQRELSGKTPAARAIRRGSIVRIALNETGQWEIVQVPQVEAALVACNADDGAVRALVGGFEFSRNKFNRVTQAWRQPGSSFKPFIYSAALEKGFMTTTVIDDAPISIDPALTGGQLWEPKNYDGKFEGPMPLRNALAKSKNMVSIRVLQSIGPNYAQDYATRVGFDAQRHPPYLTMALGAGSVTPWQMVGAYSVFANGGYRISPYLINRITDSEGRVLARANPIRAGNAAARVIDERNAFIMSSLLREVVRSGTAVRAQSLKRNDLAGKTGTTNDSHDAWFAGFQPGIAAITWVGYDQPRKLGDRETGGGLALPIWISYMGKALQGIPERAPIVPSGVIEIDGDWYYAETTPGKGISSVGLDESPTAVPFGQLPRTN